jgi:putative flavoprotein involved in K+ transport
MTLSEARTAHSESDTSFEVVVVGAGQASLTMGYFLKRQGRHFLIVEAGSIASAWRERWESLTLFTPRRYSGLPGFPFPGNPDGYPTRDEVIAYLEACADRFDLSIEEHTPVRRLTSEDGRLVLETDGKTITADQVVVATGPFQTPYVPEVAERLAAEVFQTHATGYRKPADIPEGTVLPWAAATRAFRSRRSSQGRIGLCSRSAPARPRFPSASSVAICSGG